MSRVLLLGPVLNRNRDDIIARCRELLSTGHGHEFLYLAATRPMLDAVTSRLLDGLPGALAPPNVFLLSGFSRRLVIEARDEATGSPLPSFAAIDTDQRPVQRPLMARVVARLAEAGQLPAFAPLARTDGLVEALVRLVSEIQRAGKTASEFRDAIGRRATLDLESKPDHPANRDYDADAAAVYGHFERLLIEHRLTDGNTDSLRALAVARGELDGRRVSTPFLDNVKLLVLDGFFDLLPVHQELVTSLAKQVRDVIVNVNHDDENPQAFAAHEDVIARFRALPDIEVRRSHDTIAIAPELVPLRKRLFADDEAHTSEKASSPPVAGPVAAESVRNEQPNERVVELTAPDRVREVRGVAKEIKRLAVDSGVAPDAIAVVVRSRDVYEPLVREIFADEGIPLASGERRAVLEIPAVRAAMKILDAAVANRPHPGSDIGVRHLVAIAKSDYLGVDLQTGGSAPSSPAQSGAEPTQTGLPWDDEPPPVAACGSATAGTLALADGEALSADELENAAAHVGEDLHFGDWLSRATYLIAQDVAATSGSRSSSALALSEPDELGGEGEVDDGEDSGIEGAVPEGSDGDADRESADTSRKRPRLDMPVSTLRRAVGVMTALGEAVLAIPYRAPVSEMVAAFRHALDALGYRRRLVATARESLASRDALARAAVDLRAAESLDRAIDAVAEAVRLTAGLAGGDDAIGRADFRADLERALAANSAALTPDVPGGVRFLGVTDTRGLVFDTVFVLGLVEGEFPERARGDWIYPQAERATYRDRLGLPLEDISPERSLLTAEHSFYQAVCRATSRLYLCRPTTTDEAETFASPFIGDVVRAAGPLSTLVVSSTDDVRGLPMSSTGAELARQVVRAESSRRENGETDTVLDALGALARSGASPALSPDMERRIAIELGREKLGFDEYDGLLARPDLRRMVRDGYAERSFSATNFREYGSCGFRFFAHDVLGLEPRVNAALDLQALDTGNLVHGVLQRFFALHATTDFTTARREALVADLEACAADVFTEFEQRVPPLNPGVWSIERRTLGMQLERFLDAEIALQERLSEHRAIERRVEVAFGVGRRDGDSTSVDAPLELPGDGRTIRVVGRIDRIDRSEDGSLVAYDYKTGKGPGLKDMEEGRDFQLGIYLAAIEALFAKSGETAVGGAYLTLRDEANRVTNLLADADTPLGLALYARKRTRLNRTEFREVRERIASNIRNAVERIEDGDFRVAPSEYGRTCAYCDYSSVCRIEPYRIRKKRRHDGIPSVPPLPKPRREES